MIFRNLGSCFLTHLGKKYGKLCPFKNTSVLKNKIYRYSHDRVLNENQ